jgi:hypothetical protein
VEDEEILRLARKAKNGRKFERLWAGDTSDYAGDDSGADPALCRLLGFYTGPDPGVIDRLFQQSELMRHKWLSADYRDSVIALAISSGKKFYSPGRHKPAFERNPTAPLGRRITLEECWEEMLEARVASLERRGMSLDGSPPGAGKSSADLRVIACDPTILSLAVVPTHRNCEQVRREMAAQGVEGAASPELNEDTCKRYAEARKVIQRGLSVPAALCGGCPHRRGCLYQQEYAAARKANHAIATHRRTELSMNEISKGCSYLAIREIPHDLLRPLAKITGGLREMEVLAAHARQAASGEEEDQLR